jgi:hypothetical protein
MQKNMLNVVTVQIWLFHTYSGTNKLCTPMKINFHSAMVVLVPEPVKIMHFKIY